MINMNKIVWSGFASPLCVSHSLKYIPWDGQKGESYSEGDIVYTKFGAKYLVISNFITTGDDDLKSENLEQIFDYGDESIQPSARMETCSGDQWKTVKSGVSKTNIVNKFLVLQKEKLRGMDLMLEKSIHYQLQFQDMELL